MPRNDRSDSLSVRAADDPRRVMKGLQQETELELGRAEAGQTGGVEHQGPAEREGVGPAGRSAEPEAPRPERSPSGRSPAGEAAERTEPRDAPDAPGAVEHP